MSKSKVTRSTTQKTEPDRDTIPAQFQAPSLKKIFYVSKSLLKEFDTMSDDSRFEVKLEWFYHPGKGRPALFMTGANNRIMEVLEYGEPRRSWLINNEVCSNGKIYLTTPFDTSYLALHHIRKHCVEKALSLDNIHDEKDPSAMRLLNNFVQSEFIAAFAYVKNVAGMTFYKYNQNKTLAWLACKTKRVAATLSKMDVHCGNSAKSQNFVSCDKTFDEEDKITDMDYLKMASEYVGGYIDVDLFDALQKYLEIPTEQQTKTEKVNKKENGKRKSLKTLNNIDKKPKLDDLIDKEDMKDNSLLDSSIENNIESQIVIPKTPQPKERNLTTKEKALAKSAKGTKSIASFFKK